MSAVLGSRLRRGAALLAIVSAASSTVAAPASTPPPSADGWSTAVAARLAAAGSATGLVAVRIEPDGRVERLLLGTRAAGGAPIDRATRFEIGSITKALTGELLAALVTDGTVALDDPVERHVAELRGTPAGALTLQALATHTAGLPRVPMSLAFWSSMLRDPDDPYAAYGADAMLRDLRSVRAASPGTPPSAAPYAYSNLGFALLGLAIERASGARFGDLLARHVLVPAGAVGAAVPNDADAVDGSLAQGHDGRGVPVPPWRLGAFAAAGGVRANADAMAALLDAARRGAPPFHRGAAAARAGRGDDGADASVRAVGLGWHRTERHGDRIVWHNGGTGGFRSFAGWSEVSGRAVVLLANGHVVLDDLGFAGLNPAFPVAAPPPAATPARGWRSGFVAVVGLAVLWVLLRWAWTGPRPDAARVDPAPRGGWWRVRPAGSVLEAAVEVLGAGLGLAILWSLAPRLGVWPVVLVVTASGSVLALVVLGRTLARLPRWPPTRWGRRALARRLAGVAVAACVLAVVA